MPRPPSKFSFGMIVFNGDYFLRQVLDGAYDFAHEIVIVEGCDNISRAFASERGRSADRTIEIIRNYPDPKRKIKLIEAGPFADKDEQSNAFMPHLTGDFAWLLDSDEMYHPADMERLAKALHDDPELMAVQMRHHCFYGGLERVAIGKHWNTPFWRIHRLFPGSRYHSHRPVTVLHPSGRSMNEMKHLGADQLEEWGIRMHHYSYVLDRQVEEKIRYYTSWRPTIYPIEKDIHRFHYDYVEKIWRPWTRGTAEDRERIERQWGVSAVVFKDASGNLLPDGTAPFAGKHPAALQSHPLYQQTFSRRLQAA